MSKLKRNYQVDYNRYTFKAEDDWGDYDNGKYRKPWFNDYGYSQHTYWCTDGKRHTMEEHLAKWEYFNGRVPEGLEIDHIIPIERSKVSHTKGTNRLDNLRIGTHKFNCNNVITKENLSIATKKRFENEDEIEKARISMIERWKNEEYKDSHRYFGEDNPNFGNKWNDEQRQKLSIFHKTNQQAIQHTFEMNMRKRKPLIQIPQNGEMKEWESTREAGRNGYSQGNVAAACRGENNHYYKESYWYYI